ncbi:MAG: hypothetical protein RLZZ184_1127 [Cyanobacteriota bacterium]
MINFIDNAIAPQHPNFKRTACSSAYAIAPQHPQNAIAHNYPNFKRFLGRATLTHPNTPKQRFLGRATLTLTTTLILNELLAAAQRLRSPNLFLNGDS